MAKVLAFSHVCCEQYITGAEKYLLTMVRQLQLMQYTVVLVVPNEGVLSEQARTFGIQTAVLPYPKTAALWKTELDLWDEITAMPVDSHLNILFNFIHQHAPDLIITNTSVNPMPAYCGKRIGIPVAWIVCEVIPETPYTDRSVQYIVQHADWIIAISDTVLRPFRRRHIPPASYIVIPPTVAEIENLAQWQSARSKLRKHFKLSDANLLISYVSADIVPHKGLFHFIQLGLSLAARCSHVHFLIVGHPTDSTYFNESMEKVWRAPMTLRTRFHYIPFAKQISRVYPGIDLLVIPSLIEEGFGMTALEGLMFNKPVISYRAGGLEEVLVKTGNGQWLAAKGNVPALANRVQHFIEGWPAAKKTMLRQRAVETYGLPAYVRKVNQWLQRLRQPQVKMLRQRELMQRSLPDGVLLKGASTAVYFVQNGQKRHIVDSFSFYFYKLKWECVAGIDDRILALLPTGTPIQASGLFEKYSPGTLLVKGTGPAIYLWDNGKLHAFTTANIFERLGYHISNVVIVPDPIIKGLPKDTPIRDDVLLAGRAMNHRLYRATNRSLYYSEHGLLRPLQGDAEALLRLYKWNPSHTIDLTVQEFKRLPQGSPLTI